MAYLDRIPSAVRALAAARTDADQWRTLFGWAATGVILAALFKSGLLLRVQGWLAPRISRPWLASLVGAAVFMLAFEVLRTAVVVVSAQIWPDGAAGASFAEVASGLPAHVLVGAIGLSLLLGCVRSAPRWGWVGLSGLAAVVIFCGVLIPPLALAPAVRHDAPTFGPAMAPILDFARKGGLAAERLYVFDSPSPFDVDMEGLGPFTHAAVSRAVLASPRPEAFAAMGHLLGHYRHRDLSTMALVVSSFAAIFFFAVSRLCRLGVAAGAAIGANGPAAAALVAWAVMSVAVPVFNAFDQAINYRADDYAMTLTHDPDALCRWLIAAEAESKADPSPVESLLFYTHPSLLSRLRNATEWKAGHGL